MDLADLRSFLEIARQANLRGAAEALHQSPSALSKALRRLEDSLATPLFDRVGKSLRLNAQGELLRERALPLVELAEQTRAEFRGQGRQLHARFVGPAVLQWRHGAQLAARLSRRHPDSGMAFALMYEDAALLALARGAADFALVTAGAIQASLPRGLERLPLGSITMQLAAGDGHALVRAAAPSRRRAAAPAP